MIFSYKPEGQEKAQEWVIDLGKLRSSEMEGIEARTGMAYGGEFKQELIGRNTRARRAMLWTLQRREHHTLLYKDVDFADEEVELQLDKKEWADLIDNVRKEKSTDPQEKADRIAQMQVFLDGAPEAPGKESAPSAESGTPTD